MRSSLAPLVATGLLVLGCATPSTPSNQTGSAGSSQSGTAGNSSSGSAGSSGTGNTTGSGTGNTTGSGTGNSISSGTGNTTGTGGSGTPVDPTVCTPGIPATSQLPRLTRAEYDKTTRDLLGIDVQPSSMLAPDTLGS